MIVNALSGFATAPGENPKTLLVTLEAKEQELAVASRTYKRHLEVSRAGLSQLQAVLPARSPPIEVQQYQPLDFKTREFGVPAT